MGKVWFLIAIAGGASGVLVDHASAAITHRFDLIANNGDVPGGGENHKGGQIEAISGSFTPSSGRFEWSVTFGDQITQGLTLAVNPGANPKGKPGEMALIYASVSPEDPSQLALSVYGYNGQNNSKSYKDGDGVTGGLQAPDLILSSALDGSFIYEATSTDANGQRTFSFAIDATAINGHQPVYPAAGEWTGVSYAESIGIWMHTFASPNPGAEYTNGELSNWSFGKEGWFDSGGVPTETVPTPGAFALAGLGGALALRRRRRD